MEQNSIVKSIRACNACEWFGETDCMLGAIGPICPECGETTELCTPEVEPELESFSDFINNLATEIHTECIRKGWWDDMNRDIYQTLQLVNTEIAEATEGVRKGLMDDHLPHRIMEEVELADAIIRLLDLAGRYGWDYDELAIGDLKNFDDITSEAGHHFICTRAVIYLGTAIQFNDEPKVINLCYSEAINYLLHVGKLRGYEVLAALREKFEYNKTRKDHTREARAAEGGKKF